MSAETEGRDKSTGLPGPSQPALLLTGPTAVGKTEIALLLGEQLQGEIISVDSMQVYKGLDIGTAKPSAADRHRVPHHLVDHIELWERFDAATFVAEATRLTHEIAGRGHVPILCGGTGLYFKALLEGLGNAPPANPALRAELEKTELSVLLHELAEADPECYAGIDRLNRRRVVRALEVIRLTGRPFSGQRARWRKPAERPGWAGGYLLFGMNRSPEELRARIEARVEAMFAQGWVEETQELLRLRLPANATALQALGYREIADHLRGLVSLPQTIELVKTRTRQFAKRQMRWFRHQLEVEWIHMSTSEQTAGRVVRQWRQWRESKA